MKKIIIVLIISLLCCSSLVVNAESACSRLILTYNQKFQNASTIVETRLVQRYGGCYYFVNIIEKSHNEFFYADKLVNMEFVLENDIFDLIIYDINDYQKNSYFLLDKMKTIRYSGELDEKKFLFNKRKKTEKIKSGYFSLDHYPLPYLGEKYLRNVKRVSDHLYEVNKVKVKEGLAFFLDLDELIDASYVVEESRIIETYQDQSMGRIIRIIEVGPETIDFDDLDTLAGIAQEKLSAYYSLSVKVMD